MIVFLGFSTLQKIQNLKKYKVAVKQVQHYLSLHSQRIKMIENDYLITIKPLYNNNQFTIVKDCNFLHTVFYKLHFNDPITEEQIAFFQICMECGLILKEHFPSKIQIELSVQNENLKFRLDSITEHNKNQMTRRFVSNVKMMLTSSNQIHKDELDDLLYMLRTESSVKLKMLVLNLINSNKIQEKYFAQIKEIDIQTIDLLANDDDYNRIVVEILAKIVRAKTIEVSHVSINTYEKQESVKYDQPNLLKSYIFQFRESLNLERICFLIDKLSQHIPQFDKQKAEIVDKSIFQVIQKYNSGVYTTQLKFFQNFRLIIIKYCLIRKSVKSWMSILKLLNENKEDMSDELREKIQEFCNYYVGKVDEKITNQLKKLVQKYAIPKSQIKQSKLQRLTEKNRIYEQNCRTSRNTNKSFRKTYTKSTYINP